MSAKRSQRDLQTAIKAQCLEFASTMPARLSKEAERARIVALVCQSHWSHEPMTSYYQTSSLWQEYRWVASDKNGLPLTDLPRSGRSLKSPPKTLGKKRKGVQQDAWKASRVHALGRQHINYSRERCTTTSLSGEHCAELRKVPSQTDSTIQNASW
jgi:hypothetical protein